MKQKDTIVVNFFAGPGSGKSTFCAGLFYKLKMKGIDCEMSLEYAKDIVWEESYKKLDNQIYIFGKQLHRLQRLNKKVNVVITDSPLLHSSIYCKEDNAAFQSLILSEHNKFNNLNFFIKRRNDYMENGRMQSKEEAIEIDNKILNYLSTNKVEVDMINSSDDELDLLVSKIIIKLSKK